MHLRNFIIAAILNFTVIQANSQTPDPAYEVIKLLNLDSLATKPVDSFLHAIPPTYSNIKILGSLRSNEAMGLTLYYSTGLSVWIRPKNYIHMSRIDPNRQWDLSLFKKEIAYSISVWHPDFPNLFGHL